MSFGKVSTAVAVALALVSTPALAAGQSVRASTSALSTKSVASVKADARGSTTLAEANQARGGGWLIGAGALALIIAAIVIAADGNKKPKSP